ncbi:hypothetical protein COX03_01240 [Candidatus Woesebacteria bacterium CG22_combo_CG10-13_8_21_14_all_39_10]|uniref:Uncharacterized protein n=1 Tax=Candidatus Woesebacteria bacterium CG22_combo_CG10-13_8_21_14_all_39_10 TaxID=1975059 RepID=A0A2H0BJL5_9BACT|nr:MAG: hypothetical protein COX03_01240 [Candidatus Woesebacteria bacterium CG22_combo_CG10-13_8_21_14_all_39_10]
MLRQEILEQRPEVQTGEPRLSMPEIGQHVHRLIQVFKERVRQTSELAEPLQELYLNGKLNVEHEIEFSKLGFDYKVYLLAGGEREELEISKYPKKIKDHGWLLERVDLIAHVDRETVQFVGDGIQHAKLTNDEKSDVSANTNTAVQRVEEFLTTNFGNG